MVARQKQEVEAVMRRGPQCSTLACTSEVLRSPEGRAQLEARNRELATLAQQHAREKEALHAAQYATEARAETERRDLTHRWDTAIGAWSERVLSVRSHSWA